MHFLLNSIIYGITQLHMQNIFKNTTQIKDGRSHCHSLWCKTNKHWTVTKTTPTLMSTSVYITDVDNKCKTKCNVANNLNFWQFWCRNNRIILLNKLASFWLVVIRACVCFSITMQRAEIVPTSTVCIHDYDLSIYNQSYTVLITLNYAAITYLTVKVESKRNV